MKDFLQELNLRENNYGFSTGLKNRSGKGSALHSENPTDGQLIATTSLCTLEDYHEAVTTAKEAFQVWRKVPAPKRGEVVRQMGDAFRKHKNALGKLVSFEMGKSLQEGLGEVQEIIDICDFAVGLSMG